AAKVDKQKKARLPRDKDRDEFGLRDKRNSRGSL
ncbi:MAG: hypothetical protein QOJ58_5090, partial [Alphaproteobacteria bacterium]|nr:hypothetical protein [Alphaproteobacteria bacterium]